MFSIINIKYSLNVFLERLKECYYIFNPKKLQFMEGDHVIYKGYEYACISATSTLATFGFILQDKASNRPDNIPYTICISQNCKLYDSFKKINKHFEFEDYPDKHIHIGEKYDRKHPCFQGTKIVNNKRIATGELI